MVWSFSCVHLGGTAKPTAILAHKLTPIKKNGISLGKEMYISLVLKE